MEPPQVRRADDHIAQFVVRHRARGTVHPGGDIYGWVNGDYFGK
jgi:hypothetical protein